MSSWPDMAIERNCLHKGHGQRLGNKRMMPLRMAENICRLPPGGHSWLAETRGGKVSCRFLKSLCLPPTLPPWAVTCILQSHLFLTSFSFFKG